MKLVVDSNVLFSALIKNGVTRKLLFHRMLELYSPEFILEEFGKYKFYLLNKSGRSEVEFQVVLNVIKKRMTLIPNEETNFFIQKAKQICQDKNDADYFALALKLGCPIWSNDKPIKNQSVVPVFSTHELLRMLPEDIL